MKPFIGVIAKGKAGKLTIIRSLTGCPISSYRGFLEDKLTGENILVICGSPQEQALSIAELAKLLKSAVADPNCRGVVIAIQPRRTRTRISMEAIFAEAVNADGFQLNAFIIDPARSGAAAEANEIRSRLSVFNARSETLDGQHFAWINAQIINDITSLIPIEAKQTTRAAAAGTGRKES